MKRLIFLVLLFLSFASYGQRRYLSIPSNAQSPSTYATIPLSDLSTDVLRGNATNVLGGSTTFTSGNFNIGAYPFGTPVPQFNGLFTSMSLFNSSGVNGLSIDATGIKPSISGIAEGDLFRINSSGYFARIAIGTSSQALISNGTNPIWGAIPLGGSMVSGDLPFSSFQQSTGVSVLGKATSGTGDHASITAGSDGDVLRRSGGSLAFGTIDESSVNALVTDLSNKQPLDTDLTTIAGLSPTTDQIMRYNGSAWAVADSQADPTTTDYDIMYKLSGVLVRKAKGANGTFLGVSGGVLDYYTPSATPSGSAGGDLTGTYPNPTLAADRWKLTGTSTATGTMTLTATQTAAANNESLFTVSPTLTLRSTASDVYRAWNLTPTIISGAASQSASAVRIAPTFTATGGAFSQSLALEVVGTNGSVQVRSDGSLNANRGIHLGTLNTAVGQNTLFFGNSTTSQIGADGSNNMLIFAGGTSTTVANRYTFNNSLTVSSGSASNNLALFQQTINQTSTASGNTGNVLVQTVPTSMANATHTMMLLNTSSGVTTSGTFIGYDYNPTVTSIATHYAALYRSGRVGIGTAAPTEILHVVGNQILTGTFNGITVGKGAGSVASNTAVGASALAANTSGSFNVGVGNNALLLATTNTGNTAIGAVALASAVVGATNNVAIGYDAGYQITTGQSNTIVGTDGSSSGGITTGSNNILLGYQSSSNTGVTTGSGNILIGNSITGLSSSLANNVIIAPGSSGVAKLTYDGTNWSIVNNGVTMQAGNLSGSVSQAGTATTTFTVTIGTTMANSTYKTQVTPTAALSAALFYVTNKTTTTFDVMYLAGLTGTVTFDWLVTP